MAAIDIPGKPLKPMLSETPVTRRIKPSIFSPSMIIPPSPAMKKLGFGTGVNVYRLDCYTPLKKHIKSWAVKKINKKCKERDTFEKRLLEEAKILRKLDHPNIISYKSYSKSKDGSACLVMENGQISLLNMIEAREEKVSKAFPAKSINEVIIGISSALDYLHTKHHLLHGDLKSANILIKENFKIVKLCDFGATVPIDSKMVMSDPTCCYLGTECWLAPEAIEYEGVITNKTDMFSFGLVIWEMLSLDVPHCNFDDEEEYEKHLGTRPPIPDYLLKEEDEEYDTILEIFYLCTEKDQKKRPDPKVILSLMKD